MREFESIGVQIGYVFSDPSLIETALTHPSISQEEGRQGEDNQRLEFLGDAVLQLVVTQQLYAQFPAFEEGPLTKTRAQLVNRRSLAAQAQKLDLGARLIMSRGEETSGGRTRPSALADAFEALIGAVFLDAGFEEARRFVLRVFERDLSELSVNPVLDNPKGELQEWLQAASHDPPQYHLRSVSGPDHDRVFECAVFHRGAELGRGRGKSKKEAESRAAAIALKHLRPGTADRLEPEAEAP